MLRFCSGAIQRSASLNTKTRNGETRFNFKLGTKPAKIDCTIDLRMQLQGNFMLKPFVVLMICTHAWQAFASETDIFGEKKSPQTELAGEYIGTYLGDNKQIKYGLQIFAMGDGKFRAVGYNGGLPGDGF